MRLPLVYWLCILYSCAQLVNFTVFSALIFYVPSSLLTILLHMLFLAYSLTFHLTIHLYIQIPGIYSFLGESWFSGPEHNTCTLRFQAQDYYLNSAILYSGHLFLSPPLLPICLHLHQYYINHRTL